MTKKWKRTKLKQGLTELGLEVKLLLVQAKSSKSSY